MSEPMTQEQIHGFGVRIVFEQMEKEGFEILSVAAERGVNPQIVAKKGGELAFVVVRTACYPHKGAIEDRDLELKLIEHADKKGATCYFASVGIANADGRNDEEMSRAVSGGGYFVAYDGLVVLTLSNRVRVFGEQMASDGAALPVRGPLSEIDQQWLFRCMAVVGSGSYAVRGTQEQQVVVFRQILIAAKEKGADWSRICLAVYDVCGHMMGHFPSVDEMISQVGNVVDAEQ